MKTKIFSLFIFFIMIFQIVVAEPPPKNQNLVEKQNQLEYVKSQIKQNNHAIQQINEQSSQLSQEIQQIDNLIQSTQEEINIIQSRINEKLESLRNIEYEREIYNTRLKMAQQSFNEIYVSSTGENDYWNWVVDTDSPFILNLRIEQVSNVYSVFNMAINKNWKDNTSVKEREGIIFIEKQKLEVDKSVVVQKQTFIKEQYDKKLSLFNNLSEQRDSYIQAIDDLEQSSEQLVSAINQLQSYGYSGSNIKQGKGVMLWPANGGRISSPYGYRIHPVLKTKKLHTGIDIGSQPEGSPVFASSNGIVIHSGWIKGYGNTVIIDHGNKVSTLYAHNSKLTVKEGQEVSRGEKIAEVGSTGISTGPHIHFEVRVNGKPEDPQNWL